jgi:hypothetical protein
MQYTMAVQFYSNHLSYYRVISSPILYTIIVAYQEADAIKRNPTIKAVCIMLIARQMKGMLVISHLHNANWKIMLS